MKPFDSQVRFSLQIFNQNQLKHMHNYQTLAQIASEMRIPIGTLKVKLHIAAKAGLELPPRRRIGKSYLYDAKAFSQWLWKNAEILRHHSEKSATDDVESAE